MRTRCECKPVVRGGVIGLGLGRSVFVGGGVALVLASACLAGPEGAKVAAGQATIRQRGNTTVIRAGDRSIIDYSSFDIARNETVRFIQPGATATVLNRIHSDAPTRIDGSLKSNGRVYLMNPSGILFSGTSLVQTGGLVAAAGQMSEGDFRAGVDRITNVRGDVVNQGKIVSGDAALIGRHVSNSGEIISGLNDGMIAMVSGSDVTLTPRDGTMSVKIAGGGPVDARPGVENTGRVSAARGGATLMSGDVYSLAVKSTGTVRAQRVKIDGGAGAVQVSGRVDASQRAPGGRGGSVEITGREVQLTAADIDASGARAGGRVRVGGGAQGEDGLGASQKTVVDEASSLRADATGLGHGGSVVVTSAGQTEFHGLASARGGARGGEGGAVETTGHAALDIDGSRVDAGAAPGSKAGSWLVDPTDFTVNGGNVGTFNTALDMGMDVTIETGSGGSDAGNVTIDAPISKTAGGDATLTIRAENDIVVNQPITSTAGALNIDARANTAGNGNTDPDPAAGQFIVNNNGGAQLGAINSNGGAVNITGVDVDLNGAGALIAAGAGDITLQPTGAASSVGIDGPGTFQLTAAALGKVSTTGTLTIGRADGTGAVTIGSGSGVDLSMTAYDLRLRGGAISFAQALTLHDDAMLSLVGSGVSSSLSISTPAAIVGGSNGRLLIDSTGDVNLSATARKLAARTTGSGDIDYRSISAPLEVTSLGGMGGVDGVSSATGDIVLRSGSSITLSSGVRTGGAGTVTINVTTSGDIIDNTGAMGTAITVGPAGTIGLDTVTGRIGGVMPTEALKVDTGAPSGSSAATITANGDGGVRIANAGTGPVTATLTADSGASELASGGPITTGGAWTGDTIKITSTGSGASGLVTLAHSLTADGGGAAASGDITISASDLAITAGSIVAGGGMGDVTISRASDGGINVGGGTFGAATGITDYLTLDNTELGAITAATLTIGDADHTQFIRVQDVTTPANIDRVALTALKDGAAIRFAGTAASSFKALSAAADAGIEVAQDITATTGALSLDADADMADDTAGSFFTSAHDELTFTGGRTLTTQGMGASDITLSGRRAAGMTGINADASLTLRSARDAVINQKIAVDQTLTVEADRAVSLGAGGSVRAGDVRAAAGVTLTGDLAVGAGGLGINADTDGDDAGLLSVPSGTITVTGDSPLRIVAADVDLAGSIVMTPTAMGTAPDRGRVRISRSNPGDVRVGAFTDGGPSDDHLTLDNGELSRITARDVVVGNFTEGSTTNINTNNIAVDGVTQAATMHIDRVRLDAGMDVTFSGGASRFHALDARAGGGVTVSANLTTDAATAPIEDRTANLTLIADSDADGTGALTISADVATMGGSLLGRGADLHLTGHVNTAMDGGTGAVRGSATFARAGGNVVVNNVADDPARMTIDDAELALLTVGNLTFGQNDADARTGRVTIRGFSEADGAGINGTIGALAHDRIVFSGPSTFKGLNAQSDSGIDVNTDLTTTAGDLILNGNADGTGGGDIQLVGDRTLTSAGNLTLSTAPSTGTPGEELIQLSGSTLSLRARNNVDINGTFEAQNPGSTITVAADSDGNGVGTFFLHNGLGFTATDSTLRVTAADANLGTAGTGDINLGGGSISFERSRLGTMAIGGATDGDFRLSTTELQRLVTSNLTIGGTNTSRVNVRGPTGLGGSGITGVTTLEALGNQSGSNDGVVEFRRGSGSQAESAFRALEVHARSRINVQGGGSGNQAASVSTNSGRIVLDAGFLTPGNKRDGTIRLGGNVSTPTASTTGDVTLNGAVQLLRNVTITAGHDLTINSTVDSEDPALPRSLALTGGRRTTLNGDVGKASPLLAFDTDDVGTLRLNASVFTGGGSGVHISNHLVLMKDATIEDTGDTGVFFQKRIDDSVAGRHTLTVLSKRSAGTVSTTGVRIPVIVFGDSVGAGKALKGLNLNAGVDRRGRAVDGHATAPVAASIVARKFTTSQSGAVTFDAPATTPATFLFEVAQDFVMGLREKLAAVGNLTVRAGRAARVGDIVAWNRLRVESPDIRVRAREGAVLAGVPGAGSSTPSRLTDLGTDIVAGDSIAFTSRPEIEGAGTVVFSTRSGDRNGGGTASSFRGFIFRAFQQNGAAIGTSTAQVGTGANVVNLDLTAQGPTDVNFAESIAGQIPPESRPDDVTQQITVAPALFAELQELGVNPRDLSGDERVDALAGWSTYNDYPRSLSAQDLAYTTTVNRLPGEPTRRIVRERAELLGGTAPDPATGEPVAKTTYIRNLFTAAASRYRDSRGIRPEDLIEPEQLRSYVDQTPGEAEARDYADRLDRLLRDIELLGLAGRELRQAKASVLTQVRPSGRVFHSGPAGLADTEHFIRARREAEEFAEPPPAP